MPLNSVISVRDLRKEFGERVAVNIPELDIAAGTCTGIIGPNGAGKTTLVKLVAGLLTPTRASRLEVLGSDLARAAKHNKQTKQSAQTTQSAQARQSEQAKQLSRSIGLVTNAQQLYGTLTVRENLEYMARLSRIPKKDRAELIAKALDACALADRQHDKVMTLSTGLKQRANIARALAARPGYCFWMSPPAGWIRRPPKEYTMRCSACKRVGFP
ncbi:ABC transporter ATP-binding protein [Actinotignum sp. SLA_B059]|uniref:ABC transporter ATP-binding protein n=1 Tax=Actinotignum sp. SLA_B059 TaxID=3083287 RepID=UPI002A7FDAF5|nr:ABC transporter ATP-binding protein [Actinotignum sp. SLA_B059]MDY5127327.1 ABC transporter ATP-binding protein [Actinotignum sp. SLA_B059]